jgi:hypothetical protein
MKDIGVHAAAACTHQKTRANARTNQIAFTEHPVWTDKADQAELHKLRPPPAFCHDKCVGTDGLGGGGAWRWRGGWLGGRLPLLGASKQCVLAGVSLRECSV